MVIPLERLADYNDGIERINIEYSTANKLRTLDALLDYLRGDLPELKQARDFEASTEDEAIVQAKQDAARELLHAVKARWSDWIERLDAPAETVLAAGGHDPEVRGRIRSGDRLFDLLQRRDLRISYRREVEGPLNEIFAGLAYEGVRRRFAALHAEQRASRLFVACHMHAGDGNVHTNIPVFSHDYGMLQQADRIVDRVMALARSLGGVISGEHGIGITKMQYLEPEAVEAFAAYKRRVDPHGHFNRGKLMPGSGLAKAYTLSLRLVQQEALILEASELGALNDSVRHCLRCGKCKPVCTTHVPRASLLYSPRNKILALGLIIEAFLYEEQTRRGLSVRHFAEMNDVADHCTVCHKCASPCPVDIDFGEVSIRMRNLLRSRGQKRFSPGTWASMQFLSTADPRAVKLMRKLLIQGGYGAQRLAHGVAKRLKLISDKEPPAATIGPPAIPAQVIHFMRKPMPAGLPSQPLRSLLGLEDARYVPILRNPKKVNGDSEAVFYFPGCGSERLFSQIGLATLAMLYEVGAETVLPPGYLCCGYPQAAGGDEAQGTALSTANQVLFHRIANTLNYLDIKTVIVSCGTCLDQLLGYQFARIFPGCRLLDIHEYLMEKGIALEGVNGVRYLYHDPCHSPMKSYRPVDVASKLVGQPVRLSDRCCGEAGTFAISRPDIATQVRFRKQAELQQGVEAVRADGSNGKLKVLTSCPACLQGLSRYRDEVPVEADYIVVELAQRLLGEGWQRRFVDEARLGGVERVLL